jgi:hypothetical protein
MPAAQYGRTGIDPIADESLFANLFEMIENIWHLRGSTQLPSEPSDEVIIGRLETFLAKQHKPITEQGETSIEFSSPLCEGWFTPNWLALVIYDEGRFWIEKGLEGRRLRYDLRSLHGLVFCLAGACMMFAFVSIVEDIAAGARFALPTFAWLYGANMVLAWARIPLAVRRAVSVS